MTQVTPGDGTNNYVRPTNLASVKTAVVTSAAVVAGLGFTPIQSTSNITGNASNVTGTVAVTHGGTGLTTLTNGYVLTGAGTGNVAMVSRSGIDSRTSFPPAVATGRTDATFYSVPWHSGNALYSATNVQIQSSTGTLKANILESSIVTGTAPFTVASTTMVDNLYVKWADTVDVNASNSGTGEYNIVWNSGDTVYSTTGITINRDNKSITATTFKGALTGTASGNLVTSDLTTALGDYTLTSGFGSNAFNSTNIQYSSAIAEGNSGLVPAAAATTKYLRGDGAFTAPPNTQLSNAQVIAMALTGFTTYGSASDLIATDSILDSFRKLEYRVQTNDDKVTDSGVPTYTSAIVSLDVTTALGFTPTDNTGTVISVGLSAPTGLTVSNSPITGSGTLALSFTAGYSIPTTTNQTNWSTAYTDRLKWDGGSTGLVAATGRTSLGGTDVGKDLFTKTTPATTSYIQITTGGVASLLTATLFKTDLLLQNVTNESKATMFTSAALTSTPTAPTAAVGTDTTQIATTAHVKAGYRLLYAHIDGQGSARNFAATDNNGFVNAYAECTLTIPSTLTAGTQITVFNSSGDDVTIACSGVTLNGSSASKVVSTVYAAVTLIAYTSTVWYIVGDYN